MFNRGQMTNMLLPLPSEAFIAIPACLDKEQEQSLQLDAIRPGSVSGTDATTIDFLAAWPTQGAPLRVAAGPMDLLEPAFGPYEDTSGPVQPCGAESPVTGLEIAAVLPQPSDTAIVIDGLTVEYTLGSKRYAENVDVTLGMCLRARGPSGRARRMQLSPAV